MRVSTEPTRSLIPLLALCLSVLSLSACKRKSASPGTARASDDFAAGVQDDPLSELAALENQMRSLDLSVPSDATEAKTLTGDGEAGESADESAPEPESTQPAPTAVPAEEPRDQLAQGQADRCLSICELSDAICSLEDLICGLSESHGADPVYQDACERAGEDCEVARDACQDCED